MSRTSLKRCFSSFPSHEWEPCSPHKIQMLSTPDNNHAHNHNEVSTLTPHINQQQYQQPHQPHVTPSPSPSSTSTSSPSLSTSTPSFDAGGHKRLRLSHDHAMYSSNTCMDTDENEDNNERYNHNRKITSCNNTRQSPFKASKPDIESLISLPRHKRAVPSSPSPSPSPCPAPSSSSSAAQPAGSPHNQSFTYAQVQRIVQHALEQREAQIRAEYDMKLNELLCEQFENFSSFNRDYISRTLKNNDECSYLS